MSIKLLKRSSLLLTFLWCAFWLLRPGATQCNVCLPNQAACVNTSSFHLCYGTGTPNTAVLYHCPTGFDCTAFDAICVQSSHQRLPACTLTSQCGLCSAQRNYVFACQSRNTFQMCYGAVNPSGDIGHCPSGYVCDAESDEVCVPAAQATSITCDRESETTTTSPTTPTSSPSTSSPTSPTTPTTASPTTPTTAPPSTPTQMCIDKGNKVGLYSLNDPTCLTYLLCALSNGVVTGTVKTCATGSYFNSVTLMCAVKKPTNCV